MVSKEYLIDLLKKNEVFLEGDFTLSSGKKSNYYINMKKAITEPDILSTISSLITDKIKDDEIDKVAGPALGAVPIATAVFLESKLFSPWEEGIVSIQFTYLPYILFTQ